MKFKHFTYLKFLACINTIKLNMFSHCQFREFLEYICGLWVFDMWNLMIKKAHEKEFHDPRGGIFTFLVIQIMEVPELILWIGQSTWVIQFSSCKLKISWYSKCTVMSKPFRLTFVFGRFNLGIVAHWIFTLPNLDVVTIYWGTQNVDAFCSSSSNCNEGFQGLHSQETSQGLFLTHLLSSWHVPEELQMEQIEKQGINTILIHLFL